MHSPVTGGAETAIFSAIPALCQNYHLQVLVLGKLNTPLYNALEGQYKNLFQCFDYPVYQYFFKLHIILRHIEGFDPAIMITSLWRSSWVGSCYKRKSSQVKWYAFLHNTLFFHFPDKYFTKKALHICQVVLCDSTAVRHFAQSLLPAGKAIEVLSMLTLETPQAVEKDPPNANKTIRFLFMGRLHRQKNLPLAIRFLALLKAEGYQVQFDVYGRDDGDGTVVREAIARYGLEEEVHLCGEIMPFQRNELLLKYHFYLQFSGAEGMAMSVVEAMQYGLVPIVTPVGEIKNYTQPGRSALWLENQQLKQLKITWQALIQDPMNYQNMSFHAHQRFFNKPGFASSLLTCLKNY